MNRLSRSMTWNESGSSSHPISGKLHAIDDPSLRDDSKPKSSFESSIGSWVKTPKSFFLPLHYEPSYKYPLIVWMHSDGYNESQINQVIPHISLRNYVAVGVRASRSIDASGHRFEWSESSASVGTAHDAVIAAVNEATERFSIHPDRIVLAGYRSGGAMALRVAMLQPARFAGVVSLGGTMPHNGSWISSLAELRDRRMPMLWQWATEGDHYSNENLDRDMRTAMLIRASVEVRQYVDDDEMSSVCLSDLNQWVMRRVVAGDCSGELDTWASTPTSFSAN